MTVDCDRLTITVTVVSDGRRVTVSAVTVTAVTLATALTVTVG